MSILGVVIRSRPEHLARVLAQLEGRAGLDVTHNPGDGRLVLVIEDCADSPATATMAAVALLPEVQSTSLVYEYSGPDAPASDAAPGGYNAWRSNLQALASLAASAQGT